MFKLTLDDGQKDDNDEEEKGDVKKDAVELIGVTSGVLDLVTYAPSCSHPNIHVEKVTLCKQSKGECILSVRRTMSAVRLKFEKM